jgi:transposase
LAVDASTGHIEASVLTGQDVDDPSQVGPLLDQIEHEVASVTADGAYDGEPTYERIAQRDTQIYVIIPPRVTAQPSAQFEAAPTTRDNHLLMIQSLGRLEWQEAYGYGKRALVETTMGRFKAIIGPKLRARDPRGQQAEANAAVAVLNRMLSAGRPNSVRTSAAAV